MMSSLRWSLLILGLLFIAARELWEWRRPRQARALRTEHASPVPEGAEGARLREAAEPARAREALELPEIRAREPIGIHPLPIIEHVEPEPAPASAPDEESSGPDEASNAAPLEPEACAEPEVSGLPEESALLGDAEADGDGDGDGDGDDEGGEASHAGSAAPAFGPEALPQLPANPPPLVEWPPDEERRIVALRLVAAQAERFGGRSLRQALTAEGFVLGRFAIFHKPDEERRAVLSAASLSRPGTFDPETMDSQHYGGLSLFAVLPGPKPPPEAFEELVMTARSLNERLCGVLQDERGTPLTPARIATLRERIGAGVS